MTTAEFNLKYKDYLVERHYGLDIQDDKVIAYLDELFEKELIKIPEFKFFQIKLKFNYACFYSSGLTPEKESEIEKRINELVKN